MQKLREFTLSDLSKVLDTIEKNKEALSEASIEVIDSHITIEKDQGALFLRLHGRNLDSKGPVYEKVYVSINDNYYTIEEPDFPHFLQFLKFSSLCDRIIRIAKTASHVEEFDLEKELLKIFPGSLDEYLGLRGTRELEDVEKAEET